MNLMKKKELAAKALGVGKGRLHFKQENLNEIKEAITRQDIKQLQNEGIIKIKPVKGRKKNIRRKHKRGPGKIKKKVNKRKQEYVRVTRKLRTYLISLRDRGIVDNELYWDLRKKIRMQVLKSKAGLKDYLRSVDSVDFEEKNKLNISDSSKANKDKKKKSIMVREKVKKSDKEKSDTKIKEKGKK